MVKHRLHVCPGGGPNAEDRVGGGGAGELLPGCTVTVAALCGVLRGAGTSILRPAVAWCAAAASAASSNNEITAPR